MFMRPAGPLRYSAERTTNPAMSASELEKYKEHVSSKLSLITETLARISMSDYSQKVNISELPEDEFTNVFCGLDILMEDLQEAQSEIRDQSEINRLRVEFWKLIPDKKLTENDFVFQVLRKAGEFFSLARASYYVFRDNYDAECIVQWSESDRDSTIGLTVPGEICRNFLGKQYVSVDEGSLEGPQKDKILKIFNDTGINSFLAIFFPDTENPTGFVSFSDARHCRSWNEVEIDFLNEIVKLLCAKIGQIKAEDALVQANERLEKRVKKRTQELRKANEELREDIAKREEIERRLKSSEREKQRILDSLSELVLYQDTSLNIVWANSSACTDVGLGIDEISGKRCYELWHQSSSPCQGCPVVESMENGRACRKEISTPDGRIWDIRAYPVRDPDGTIVGSTEITSEITEAKRLLEMQRESDEKFKAVAQSAHEAIFSVDEKGAVVFWNSGAELMFGYVSGEIIGHSFEVLMPEQYRNSHKNPVELFSGEARGERKDSIREGLAIRKNGESFPIELSVSSWEGRNGNFYTAVIRDVSMRKAAERELAEEKELLEVTLRSISDGVISTDTEGRIVLANTVAASLLGWNRDELIDRSFEEVFPLHNERTSEPCENPVVEVIKTSNIIDCSFGRILESKDGTKRHIAYASSPMRDSDGQLIGVVLVFRDITEQQKMENELFKARKLESVGLLAGGIAHDFNNILTGIVTNLFMAKMNIRHDDEAKQLIMDAEKAAFRASRLTKQLLTFSKGGTPVKENASIKEIIEDSVGFCLSGSNVDYALDLPDDLWAVEVDRGQVDQVLNNLVINANQSMPEGGTIRVGAANYSLGEKIKTGTASTLPMKPGNYIKISVSDEGVGIHSRDLEKIFDPYFSTKQDGSGLGLTTAFSIVKKHGGHMTARSTPGKGSKFIFYLPASAASSENEKAEEEQLIPGTNRILVMDDDEVVRMVVRRLITTSGYDVVCTSNGSEAVEAYGEAIEKDEGFDAVIMDLTVPGGMGGREAVRKILEIDEDAKVIVFSGYSNDPVLANYRKYGFSGVIAKPFSIEEFSKVLNKIMSRQQNS
ncbi:MAG: PAS domain S-box protein [Chitinivibrionales bacterium]|nr:PAS domain S-box protein [Chitinivibrionales bacterium]